MRELLLCKLQQEQTVPFRNFGLPVSVKSKAAKLIFKLGLVYMAGQEWAKKGLVQFLHTNDIQTSSDFLWSASACCQIVNIVKWLNRATSGYWETKHFLGWKEVLELSFIFLN